MIELRYERLCEELERFTADMRNTLNSAKNRTKGNPTSESFEWLRELLAVEVEELNEAKGDLRKIMSEAVDVACFALFIHAKAEAELKAQKDVSSKASR